MDLPPDSPLAPQPDAPADLGALARLVADIEGVRADAETGLTPAPLTPLPQMALARGRVHEATGPARRTLAALAAGVAQGEGPVLWLRPKWGVEELCPQGLKPFVPDPGALILGGCCNAVDILWAAEEALRAGSVALVIAELAEAPDLRQLRRLHLAAADGLARNRLAGRISLAPLGVLFMHETASSRIPGVESRWALHPLPPEPGSGPALGVTSPPRWRLDRQMMRGQPPRDWVVDLCRVRDPVR